MKLQPSEPMPISTSPIRKDANAFSSTCISPPKTFE